VSQQPRLHSITDRAGGTDLGALEPVPALLKRVRAELAGDFGPGRPIRISRAPGRLDVMGGIADYTGSLVCEITLDRAAAVALQSRDDRFVQVFSFNLFDGNQPFTFRIPLDSLADSPFDSLRVEFNQPGRKWAGYIAGCLAVLHRRNQIDLKNPSLRGVNLALLSTVPMGAGVSSSAAIEVAAMINLIDHFQIRRDDPMLLASMCQEVENQIVGAPCGIMDQVSCCAGTQASILRMTCQPHELQSPLVLPRGIRVVGINSNVKHSIGGGMYGRTRCAAFMGHRMILEKMRDLGIAAGKTLQSDPMHGYLANLDPDDYKRIFRPFLPAEIGGKIFLDQYGPTIDTATAVDPDQTYHVLQACDHHVLEARRVRNFAHHLETAAALADDSPRRKLPLDKAGHLMYASHLSYTNDALLGAPECDLLVKLVRDREPAGLYGAKITGGGSGGTVAVLADITPRADAALDEIMAVYEQQSGHKPEAFRGSSPGAWAVGTAEMAI
jgi:galactokinase